LASGGWELRNYFSKNEVDMYKYIMPGWESKKSRDQSRRLRAFIFEKRSVDEEEQLPVFF